MPAWLENQVVGSQLRFLVGQFEAVAGKQIRLGTGETWANRVRTLLSNELPEVLENGLGKLSEKRLRELIQQPRTLLALQELVFVEGGEHWRKIPISEDLKQNSASIQKQTTEHLGNAGSTASVELRKPPLSINRRNITVLAALAASILVAVFVFRPTVSSGRYFARADLLTSQGTGKDFLLSLSRAIDEDWRQGRENSDLKSEIKQLRDSCDKLLAAELAQLDSAVATDLKQRCQKWRDTFKAYISELEAGASENSVRKKVDETVQKLVIAIEKLS